VPKIFQVLDKMHPVYDKVYKVVMFVCKALLVIDILITTYAVLERYIPFLPTAGWSQELVILLMVYMAVLSATLAIRTNSHIRMTAFDNKLPKNLVRVLDVLADIGVLALGLVMLIYGINFVNSPLGRAGTLISLPSISRRWMFIPVPLAGATMILFELEQIYLHIKAFFMKEDQQVVAKIDPKEVQAQ
jgi:TRAP-type C4-dicarboxylate transport system permease small subunit